jgi:phage terminase large subunit
LTLYSFKVDKLTNEVLPVLEDKANHVIDSLRYAIEPLRGAQPLQVPAGLVARVRASGMMARR